MWDVVWTDPDRELVGDRRARKGKSRNGRSTVQSHCPGRDSLATESSSSSTESPFSRFRSKATKDDTSKTSDSSLAKTPPFSGMGTPSFLSSISPFSQAFEIGSRRSSDLITTAPTSPREDRASVSQCDNGSNVSEKRNLTESLLVAKCKNLSCSHDQHCHGLVSLSHDQCDGEMTEMEKTGRLMQLLQELSSQNALSVTRPLSPDGPRGSWDGQSTLPRELPQDIFSGTPPKSPAPKATRDNLNNNLALKPPPKSPLRPLVPKWSFNNPVSWRPPENWKPTRKGKHGKETERKNSNEKESQKKDSLDTLLVQLDVCSMATTPPPVMLRRLQHLQKDNTGNANSKEIQTEKMQWMLSMLQALHGTSHDALREGRLDNGAISKARVMVIIHESPVTIYYLSTVYPATQVYDLSSNSVVEDENRNVHHLVTPAVIPTTLPVAPRLFDMAYSISLCSKFGMSELGEVLDSIHRCLKDDGVFKLTIIDPIPHLHTLGEKMTGWLNQYLVPNLTKKGISKEPSQLLPRLLGDAALRGAGSRRTKTKFYALPESARSCTRDPDTSLEKLRQDLETKAELRSLIGRVLWFEVWGSHVSPQPAKWWWEDEACMEECRVLGTFWEFHVIDATKMV